MAKLTLLSCYAIVCFFVGRATSAVNDPEVKPIDVFQVLEIRKYDLKSAMDSLNGFLLVRTESSDPKTNLDIIIDELISNYKIKFESNTEVGNAKRLLASLSLLEGKNLCSSFGSWIIDLCVKGLGFSRIVRAIKNQPSRRVDKIFAPFVKRRTSECTQVYLDKFSEISSKLDKEKMERLNKFLDGAIKKFVPVEGDNYAEKLFNKIQESDSPFYNIITVDPSYTYNALKNSAAEDDDARFLAPVENEGTGSIALRRDKFDRLFNDYIYGPCQYFLIQLGADVFEPVTLDSSFYHKVQKDRADFYEAWVKYRFCYFELPSLKEVVEYVRDINYHNQ